MSAKRMRVTGLVQGVLFRATTKEMADRFGVKGWVRNTDDGSVEIHAEGNEAAISTLVAWCHEGPPAAQVNNVAVEVCNEEGFGSFEIRH